MSRAFPLALLALMPVTASAQDWLGGHDKDGAYLSGSAGLLVISDADGDIGGTGFTLEYDEGFVLGAALGYKFGVLRFETEFEYGRSGFDRLTGGGFDIPVDGDFNLLRWTASGYYDFDNLSAFTPYFGGGLGALLAEGDDATVGGVTVELRDELYFTAHGEAGLAYDFSNSLSLVPAYRFIYINSGEDGIDDDTAHLFKLGLRYHF